MSTANGDGRNSWAEYKRLRTVEDLLDDINAAAWESMERKDFADSAGELAKLDQVKPARQAVHAEADQALARYRKSLTNLTARRSRGIERSR